MTASAVEVRMEVQQDVMTARCERFQTAFYFQSPILPGSSPSRLRHTLLAHVTGREPSAIINKLQQEIPPMDLHHPILREFPEHREIIRHLKNTDDHFRSLFTEYHRLDDEIYRIEEEIDFATDQEIEELKMRRAKLKDYIYHCIRHAPVPCPVCAGSGVAS